MSGMARYMKKPVVVEAVQWLKPGDHPAVLAESAGDASGYIDTPEGRLRVESANIGLSPALPAKTIPASPRFSNSSICPSIDREATFGHHAGGCSDGASGGRIRLIQSGGAKTSRAVGRSARGGKVSTSAGTSISAAAPTGAKRSRFPSKRRRSLSSCGANAALGPKCGSSATKRAWHRRPAITCRLRSTMCGPRLASAKCRRSIFPAGGASGERSQAPVAARHHSSPWKAGPLLRRRWQSKGRLYRAAPPLVEASALALLP